MVRKKLQLPIYGRTFSLYGNTQSSNQFYEQIENLIDDLLKNFSDTGEMLAYIKSISKNKYQLKNNSSKEDSSLNPLLKNLHSNLSSYITNIDEHLKSLPLLKKWDWVLSTTREQYYLYMLEFALVNRLNIKKFKGCNFRIALLPHCVRDLNRDCLSKPDNIDYKCMGCSKYCRINDVSKLLKKHDISPYIWKVASLKSIFKELKIKYGTFGVLGIACIPELIKGMRTCSEKNIPVVGIPLDANRCARWMGEFYDNTVNIEKLEKLLT